MWLRDVSFGAPEKTSEARENAGSPVKMKLFGKRTACALDDEFGKRRFPASIGACKNKVEAGPGLLRAYLHAFDRRFTYSRPVRRADEVPAPPGRSSCHPHAGRGRAVYASDHRLT